MSRNNRPTFIKVPNAEKEHVDEFINCDHIIRLSPIVIKPKKISNNLTSIILTNGNIRTKLTPEQIIEKTITASGSY